MELGVPVTTSKITSRRGSPLQRPDSVLEKYFKLQ